MGGGNMQPGDWLCPACGDHQFARNDTCRKCANPKPANGGGCGCQAGMMQPKMLGASPAIAAMGGKPGDWLCPACGDHQFARNENCRKCGEAKPAEGAGVAAPAMGPMPMAGGRGQMQMPGDWSCPACGDLQFARNSVCRMCSTPKPEEGDGSEARARSRSPRRWL